MGACDEKCRRKATARWPPPPEEEVVHGMRNSPKLRAVSVASTTGMPDERAARMPNEWRRTVDVTREFNAMIGSLNQL